MIGRVPSLWRPFLDLAARPLKPALRGLDLDCRDGIERSDLPRHFGARYDRGLRIDYSRIALQAAAIDAKFDLRTAKLIDRKARRARDLLEEARPPFENRGGARQAVTRQRRREHRITAGFGIRKPLPIRQHLHARLRQRHMIVNRDADSMHQLLSGQLHQPSDRERHCGQAHDRRIPTARGDIAGIDQAAVHFIGDDDGDDQLPRAASLGFCRGEAGRDQVARMRRKTTNISVIEIEVSKRGAIRERRQFHAGADIGANDGRDTQAIARHVAADAHRPFVESADAATDRIYDMHLCSIERCGVDILVAQVERVTRQVGCQCLRQRHGWFRRAHHSLGRRFEQARTLPTFRSAGKAVSASHSSRAD